MRGKGRKLRGMVCPLLALGILVLETASANALEVPAVCVDIQTEVSDVAEDAGLTYATNAMPEIVPLAASGMVMGTGVVLREGPDTSTKVLELMEYGEVVIIDRTISSAVPGGYWYYVKRTKTGTWGWVDSSCIYRY